MTTRGPRILHAGRYIMKDLGDETIDIRNAKGVSLREMKQCSDAIREWLDAVADGQTVECPVTQRFAAIHRHVMGTALERGAKWEITVACIQQGMPAELALMIAGTGMHPHVIDLGGDEGDEDDEDEDEELDEGDELTAEDVEAQLHSLGLL
jgi:hypothetical protein